MLSNLDLFNVAYLPDMLGWFLLLGVVPYAIAYIAWKKGYSFALFFVSSVVFCNAAIASLVAWPILLLYLPKRDARENAFPAIGNSSAEKVPATSKEPCDTRV